MYLFHLRDVGTQSVLKKSTMVFIYFPIGLIHIPSSPGPPSYKKSGASSILCKKKKKKKKKKDKKNAQVVHIP